MRLSVTYDISIKGPDETVNGFPLDILGTALYQKSVLRAVRTTRCTSHDVNLRTMTLLTFAVVLIALPIAICHRVKQSKTSPLSYRRVTAEMLDKARASAQINHKFLMVEFGADWCSDCLELSKELEKGAVRNYLKEHFVVLNVDVGQFNRNIDVAKSLGVDINQGIPTVVFFPPSRAVPSKKLGTNQILAYLNDVVEQPQTTIQ